MENVQKMRLRVILTIRCQFSSAGRRSHLLSQASGCTPLLPPRAQVRYLFPEALHLLPLAPRLLLRLAPQLLLPLSGLLGFQPAGFFLPASSLYGHLLSQFFYLLSGKKTKSKDNEGSSLERGSSWWSWPSRVVRSGVWWKSLHWTHSTSFRDKTWSPLFFSLFFPASCCLVVNRSKM